VSMSDFKICFAVLDVALVKQMAADGNHTPRHIVNGMKHVGAGNRRRRNDEKVDTIPAQERCMNIAMLVFYT